MEGDDLSERAPLTTRSRRQPAPDSALAPAATLEAHALYVYCLVAAPAVPNATRVPAGLAGASSPRLVPAGPRRWLVAADAPLDRYGAQAIENGLGDLSWVSSCAVAHEAVIEHFLNADDVRALLPMKLFTLFASESSALAHLNSQSTRTGRLLRRLAGCVELGVRVLFDPQQVPVAPRGASLSGRAFLEQKRLERDASKMALEAARAAVNELYEGLASVAKDARRLEPPAGPPVGRLLLDAAFLSPRAVRPRFESVLEAGAARLLPLGCEVVLSGPWPAYHFLEQA